MRALAVLSGFLLTALFSVSVLAAETAGVSAHGAIPTMIDHPGAAICLAVFVLSYLAVLNSEITNVLGPIVVSQNTSNGWRDIVLRVSGTNMADRNVAMRFDGESYPVNPLGESEIAQLMGDVTGDRLFP